MSKVQVDTIDTRSGTSTMQIGSTNTSTINIGVSGDTVNIPSGVTIANAGTATGFGGVAGTESFMAILPSEQSVSDNTWVKVSLSSETIDEGNNFDTSNYKYVVPSAGKYFFAWCISFATDGSFGGDYGYANLYKNGSAVLIQNLPTHNTGGGAAATWDTGSSSSSGMLDLAANDYIELYGRFNWNSNASVGNFYGNSSRSTWLCGYRVA